MYLDKTKKKKHIWAYAFFILIVCNIFVWHLLFAKNNGLLTVAVLDVGQGDGIYVESPSGHQMLVDAGPQGKILKALPSAMSFYDKSIDVIVITNPDADHIAGFIDILKNYKVGLVVEPGTFNKSATYAKIEQMIAEKNIPRILAKRGMKIHMGGGAVFTVLFPDRDVSNWSVNDASVVGRLTYGKTSIMLTGDSTKKTEGIILSENQASGLKSDVLKVGHHGSRTSTSPDFVSAISPVYAVMSDGKENSYGHPHKETLSTLEKFKVKILRTDLLGTIIIKSDGQSIWLVSLLAEARNI